MAKVVEGDVEYESDPEEEKLLLGRRRREAASDDEEVEPEEKSTVDRRAPVHSDESDGQGGAADYDDEDERLEEEEEVLEDVEDDKVYEDYEEEENATDGLVDGGFDMNEEEVNASKVGDGADGNAMDANLGDEKEEGEEGEKAVEPFAVPTAGAFYMHDDRFRDNDGGRHRKTYGERKLWESKDDKKWGHDKFEEMNLHDRPYEQGRRGSKGRYQGRGGKNQGLDRGYGRRTRGKTFSNGDDANQTTTSRIVRGRGPRKFENQLKRSGQAPPTQHKQPERSFDRSSRGSTGRYAPVPNTESDQALHARKNASLSYASPPFYPSVSSDKSITVSQKKEAPTGSTSRNPRGKAAVDSVDINKLYVDDSVGSKAGKLNNVQMPVVNTMQSRTQAKGVAVTAHMSYQSTAMQNKSNRVSSASQPNFVQRNSAQNRVQSSVQSSSQKLGQLSGSGSQASSPPKTSFSANSYESADVETSSESGRSRGALVGKEKGNIQGSGRGSFVYGGAQVMGAAGNLTVSHGDQNFPRAPTFLPVMQFGGQHPGGLGVPTVGMAFPGYVEGLGNSEMTWLPVLAGAAGALGASYCPPYIAVDGSYHPRPSGQTSSVNSSSKENNTTKSNDERNLSNRTEPVNDEFGQRQKPRRYSEMDFKQPSTSA